MGKVEKLVSIIVPVYNAEKYLNGCLASIISQTYQALEIILIDDGSVDHSGDICEAWQERDSRVKVFHHAHSGVSNARNVGLAACAGMYITFVDSDDSILEDYVETLVHLLEKWNAQVVQCGHFRDFNDRSAQLNEYQMSGRDFLQSPDFQTVMWGKLYRRECLKDVHFPTGKIYEDTAILYRLLYDVQSVAYSSEKLYYYRPSDGTQITSRALHDLTQLDKYLFLEEAISFYQDRGDHELQQKAVRDFCYEILSVYGRIQQSFPEHKEVLHTLKEKYRQYYLQVMKDDSLRGRTKALLTVAYVNPGIWAHVVDTRE